MPGLSVPDAVLLVDAAAVPARVLCALYSAGLSEDVSVNRVLVVGDSVSVADC